MDKHFGQLPSYDVYTMVGGWMLYYAYMEATGKLAGLDNTAVSGAFSNMLSTPQTMALWAIIAIVISFGACAFGVQKVLKSNKGNDDFASCTYDCTCSQFRFPAKCKRGN